MKPIQLTVALPVFNSSGIVWLALEGLTRQEQIDFGWELIVIEEQEFQPFGEENFKKIYEEYLKTIGCLRFIYVSLKEWVPLSKKWKMIGELMDEESEVFVLQAADCYSHSLRLKNTKDAFDLEMNHKEKSIRFDWYNQQFGFFYDINLGKVIKYDQTTLCYPTGLNMAFRAEYARKLYVEDVKIGVDRCLYQQCVKLKGSELTTYWDNENWDKSLDVNGMNNISHGRQKFFKEPKPPFVKTHYNLSMIVSKDIELNLIKTGEENKLSLQKIVDRYSFKQE